MKNICTHLENIWIKEKIFEPKKTYFSQWKIFSPHLWLWCNGEQDWVKAALHTLRMFRRHSLLDSALKEVFRRLGRLVGRHPLLFLVVPMVASTILSTGMYQVAGKNNLSYRRIYSNYFHALRDLIIWPWHTGESPPLSTSSSPTVLTSKRKIFLAHWIFLRN